MNPFDFVNDINFGKKDIMTDSNNPELAESTYNPFLTNRALSYFPDTIQFANMMNNNSHICLLYTSPSPRDGLLSRMPSSA